MPEPLCPRIAVLNPGGKDPYLDYTNGLPSPNSKQHPPVNYHAFAACTAGAFFRDLRQVLRLNPQQWLVLVLLRSDYSPAIRALQSLTKAGFRCLIALKESGIFQVNNNLLKPNRWQNLRTAASLAHGAIATTNWSIPLLSTAGAKQVFHLPTPYPIESTDWNFQIPDSKKFGIFLGTREFDTPSRIHLLALEFALPIALKHQRKITLIDDGSAPRWWRKLHSQSDSLQLIRGPLPYPDYLRLLASHELVFQLDASRVPGQVAGDCTLARVLCIGGNGEIERIVFPQTSSFGKNLDQLLCLLESCLAQPQLRLQLEQSAWLAAQSISFTNARQKIANLWMNLSSF